MPKKKRTYRRSLSLLLAVVQLLVLFALPVSADGPGGGSDTPADAPADSVAKVAAVLDTKTTIASNSLTALDPSWNAAYVTFTPAEAGNYKILAEATAAEGSTPMTAPLLICAPATLRPSGMEENGSPWKVHSVYTLEQGQAYTFRVKVPTTGLDTSQPITVTVSQEQGGGPGPGGPPLDPADAPADGVPKVAAVLDTKTTIASNSLTALDPSWNAAYVTFTPAEAGNYKILAEATANEGGAPNEPVLICRPSELRPSGGSGGNSGTDGAWSCYSVYTLEQGQAYTFRVKVPTTGLDTSKPITVTATKEQGGGGPGGPGGPGSDPNSDIFSSPGGTWKWVKTGTKLVVSLNSGNTSIDAGISEMFMAGITEVEFSAGITEVHGAFFTNCTDVKKFVFPSSVTIVETGRLTLADDVIIEGFDRDKINSGGGPGGPGGPGGGMPNLYPVPSMDDLAPDPADTSKVITADLGAEAKDIRDKLVPLTADWNVVYLNVTPPQDGIYKTSVTIPGGFITTAQDQPMPQTFRCMQPAQWSGGGCEFNGGSGDIFLADFYRMEAGKTYNLRLLLCNHGIDYTKPVLLTVQKADCPLRTDDIFADGRQVVATIKGFYNMGGSDSSVTADGQDVVINARSGQSVQAAAISIEAASTATLAENNVKSATIETDVVDVSFDGKAVSKMAAPEESVMLNVSKQEASDSLTVSLNMRAGMGTPVLPESTSDQNGQVTVSVPYETADGNTVTVEYVRPDGTTTPVEASYDKQSKTVTFSTNHFSDYKITEKPAPDDTEEIKPPCDGKTNCPTKDYTDVKKDAWYHTQGYVDYVVTRGVMTGTGTNPLRFEPDEKVTRAQMVETLWKMEGKPKITAAEADKAASAFTDVSRDAWYTGSIYWAYTKGLAEGVGGQKFTPDEPMTREQMVTFLYRYAKLKGENVTAEELPAQFSDRARVGDYAKAAMAWAVKHKLITGMNTSPETIVPQAAALRGQLAKILTVYLQMME